MSTKYCDDLVNLMALQFALIELNLFLDTHPNCQDALCDFNEYAEKFDAAVCAYEKKNGPLFNFGLSESGYPWQWATNPWPWDI